MKHPHVHFIVQNSRALVRLTTKVLRSPLLSVRDRSRRPGSTAPSSPRHSPQRSLASGDESWQPLSSTDTRLEMTGSTASLAHTCLRSHSCSTRGRLSAYIATFKHSPALVLPSVRVFANLLAVHHVPEAGQRVNPDVNVLVLNGPHGQLQRCSQVTAAGRQLQRCKTEYFSIKCIFNTSDFNLVQIHLQRHMI